MIRNIDINKLYPHPNNPRKDLGDLTELAESIKVTGVLQNLTVVHRFISAAADPDDGEAYTVIIGHRRRAAAKLAGLTEVPCAVVNMDERTQIATMLLENLQRSDLTIAEQAEGFQMMLDLGETVKGIADKTGFSEATVRHRVKLNELDKKKLSDAVMRGGRLEDYIALEKIRDSKRKNKVLEYIGTRDFDWKLQSALDEEAMPERKKALNELLSSFAKPTKESSGSGMDYIKNFYNFKHDDFKVPPDASKSEYLYKFEGNSATLYRKTAKAAPKKVSVKEKEFNKHEAQLKAISKRAYELRYAFIKNFSAAKKYASEIHAFAFRRLTRYGSPELNNILKLFDVEKPEGEDYKSEVQELKRRLIFEKYAAEPERAMLIAAYVAYDDKPSNDYYSAQSWSLKIDYYKNDSLDALYDSLIALGYELSDEEQQLRDGTHELFDRPVSSEETA